MSRDNDPDETRGRELYRAQANGQAAFDTRIRRNVTTAEQRAYERGVHDGRKMERAEIEANGAGKAAPAVSSTSVEIKEGA